MKANQVFILLFRAEWETPDEHIHSTLLLLFSWKARCSLCFWSCADGGWSSRQDWEKKTWKSTKPAQTNKDRQIIVYSDPTKLQPEARASSCASQIPARQTISQLDVDTRGVNSAGKKRERQDETKAEGETVRRERDGWQCVGGSLSSSFGEAFCWQQGRHLSSSSSSSSHLLPCLSIPPTRL